MGNLHSTPFPLEAAHVIGALTSSTSSLYSQQLAAGVVSDTIRSASRNRRDLHVSKTIEGSCLCGASGFTATADIQFAIQCYCRDCQHISGGAKLPQIAVSSRDFALSGNAKVYTKTSDTGNTVKLMFCADCGSPLCKSTSKMRDKVFLCAGSLETDLVSEPFQKVFEDCRRIWDT